LGVPILLICETRSKRDRKSKRNLGMARTGTSSGYRPDRS
jgi:hypothetical protein